jgi:hypothetical protein
MASIVDTIVEGLLGKKKKKLPDAEKPVEEMADPVSNPDRPLKMGEIHKIGRAAKPR